jgi:hypothetical protein
MSKRRGPTSGYYGNNQPWQLSAQSANVLLQSMYSQQAVANALYGNQGQSSTFANAHQFAGLEAWLPDSYDDTCFRGDVYEVVQDFTLVGDYAQSTRWWAGNHPTIEAGDVVTVLGHDDWRHKRTTLMTSLGIVHAHGWKRFCRELTHETTGAVAVDIWMPGEAA